MTEVAYARAGDSHVAYRVTGRPGGIDVVVVAGACFFEAHEQDRVAARSMAGLASLGRLVVFAKRRVGLSDPMTDWERSAQEQWAGDPRLRSLVRRGRCRRAERDPRAVRAAPLAA